VISFSKKAGRCKEILKQYFKEAKLITAKQWSEKTAKTFKGYIKWKHT